jgi:hypothetical protein
MNPLAPESAQRPGFEPISSRPVLDAIPSRLALAAWAGAFLALLLHLVTNARFGMFRDEFYYLACADHLAWGYVDHPPFSIAALAAWRAVVGDSVWALRIVPAILHAAVALGAGDLARRIGGGKAAQGLAALTTALVPGILAITGFTSMNAWEVAFWMAAVLIVAILLAGADRRLWLLLGLVAGLGMLNKYGIALGLAGLALGVLLSPLRRDLRTRWPWLALAIAVLLFLPHILWEIRHGWPTREFMDNARRYKMTALAPGAFWGEQVIQAHPLFTPLWAIGLGALLLAKRLRPFRALGVAFLVPAVVLTFTHGKPYYLMPAYPPLLAAGSVMLFGWLARLGPPLRRGLTTLLMAGLTLAGLAIAPLAVPLLPLGAFLRYQARLGVQPDTGERHAKSTLPQHFADRFGWRELADDVARAWRALPDSDRAACTILTRNYGEAGAIAYFEREPGFPAIVSTHNSYHTWGPGDRGLEVVLAVGFSREDLEQSFREVTPVGEHHAELAMPYEADLTIWLCRGPLRPVGEMWQQARWFI